MSNLLPSDVAEECRPLAPASTAIEALPQRLSQIGSLEVRRVLPVRGRRLIGPWCFLDRYGPLSFGSEKPMDVAPHPHIGLQTVTWLLSGEVLHNDSLDSECLVRPGQLSLMTAGRGIAHTEETPVRNSGKLDGVQLWVALPDENRGRVPEYQCTPGQPTVDLSGGLVTAILGEIAGARSSGRLYTPTVGAEIDVHPGREMAIPLESQFEHGALLVGGDASLGGVDLERDTLYYLGVNRSEICISSRKGAKVILIGGAPFAETVLMWWNFVARTQEEIASARQAWENHEFSDVPRYAGPRVPAPEFIARPTPSSGP